MIYTIPAPEAYSTLSGFARACEPSFKECAAVWNAAYQTTTNLADYYKQAWETPISELMDCWAGDRKANDARAKK